MVSAHPHHPLFHFRGGPENFRLIKKGGTCENLLLWRETQKSKGVDCDPQGHHAFGKYIILFMIIFMMVKLGLVL